MEESPVIKSVQSKVRYLEPEFTRIINKQIENTWFRRRKQQNPEWTANGFATLFMLSAIVPLTGVIEIAYTNSEPGTCILQVPSSAHFLVSCFDRKEKQLKPLFAVSLS